MKTQPKILVIDDEQVICDSFTSILSNKGYQVDTMISPREGLDLAASEKYNLVFLDLRMEEMNGIELFQKLREMAPDLPVVVVTGYPSINTAIASMRLHASDYILKPFTPDDILQLTRRIIPEVSPLDKDVKRKLSKPQVLPAWKSAGKPILFYETAWLDQGEDGTFRVGGQLPDFIADNIAENMLPEVNDKVYQGLPLAGSLLNYKFRIIIPSPVSGRIMEVNHNLSVTPPLLDKYYFEESWIARIDPDDFEKDFKKMQMRNIVILSKPTNELKEYKDKLANMGYGVYCIDSVSKAITALKKEKNKVVFINAASFDDDGPEFIQSFNKEIPEAKVVIIGNADSEFEEALRKNNILYYCINTLFNKEIADILYSIYSSFKPDIEIIGSYSLSIIPHSISRMHITNRHSKNITLFIFGNLLNNNQGIGFILLNKLLKKAFPLEVTRSINRSRSDDPASQQLINEEKEHNDLIITFQAKNFGKIPGQIQKNVDICSDSNGTKVVKVNISIQKDEIGKSEKVVFNNHTTKAIAELIFEEMTSFGI